LAYKTFVNGFPLNASEINNNLMNQAIATFANATARDEAITSPAEGQVVYLENVAKFVWWTGADWEDLVPGAATSTVSNKTANYSTVSGDAGNTINSTGSAITITIDNNLTAAQRIDFVQTGSGQITFAAGSGVTLNSKGGKLKTAGQYSAATVLCLASGSYLLVGDLGS
jgi:hypothetical protein